MDVEPASLHLNTKYFEKILELFQYTTSILLSYVKKKKPPQYSPQILLGGLFASEWQKNTQLK